jgi:uncharacterized membrane protein HdeD (DUF308 family)
METKGYRNWWMMAVNGLIAIVFGFILLLLTAEDIKKIAFFFGIGIFAAGILMVFLAIRNIKKDKGGMMIMLEAVAILAIGAIIMLSPANSLKLFLILIGIWTLVLGIVQLVILINIRDVSPGKNILLFSALLTIALGVILFFDPLAFAVFVAKILGVIFILCGTLMIYMALVLKKSKSPENLKP